MITAANMVQPSPLVDFNLIKAISITIAEKFRPEQVILFGSYAYGSPSPHSDVDLLVVMPFEGHEAQQALAIRQQIKFPFPVDILVRSPQQLRERLAKSDWFMHEIVEKGQVLYAAANSRVD